MLGTLPSWLGTVPQWTLVFLVAIAVVRTSPSWLETWASLRLARSNRNRERIIDLERQVSDCRKECDEQRKQFQAELQASKEQRNQEQLVIMRAIVKMSNDPAVAKQLELLEAMELSLNRIRKTKGTENGGTGK